MKKKKWVILSVLLCILLIGFVFINYVLISPVFLYIENVENANKITLNISDGQGHYKYKRYKLIEIEDGVYQIQAYGSLFLGQNYPIVIEIDNSDGHIKEILQKDLDGKLQPILGSK